MIPFSTVRRLPALRALAVAVAALAVFAAPPARAQEPVALEIGYMPILPVSQLFVGLETGALARAGIEPELVRFQDGPAMVQALLADQLDVAYLGIGPAMVARAKGADVKVVASNIVEQISFLAVGELAEFAQGEATAETFAAFRAETGRPARITTFPRGSVPDTVLQYWLINVLGADPADLEIIHQGTAQVQQALLTGAVDGAATLEPIVSIILERVEGAAVLASGSGMFPDQPGAVLVVRERVIAEHPEIVRALVAAHAEATDRLAAADDVAVAAAQVYVGGGRLPEAIVRAAVERSAQSFRADPASIIEGARAMRDFQAEQGTLKAPVDIEALFDTSFFPVR